MVGLLLMLHEFAFPPVFAGLREVTGRQKPPTDLADVLYEDAYWDAASAREKVASPADADRSELDELVAAARDYPALLEPVPLRYALACKWRSLRRALGLYKWCDPCCVSIRAGVGRRNGTYPGCVRAAVPGHRRMCMTSRRFAVACGDEERRCELGADQIRNIWQLV